MYKASDILKSLYCIEWINLNILECGANTHGEETRELIHSNNCWYVEANPSDFELLKRTKINALNYALSDKCGSIEFTISSHPGNSSCEHSTEHLNELKNYSTTFKKIQVESVDYITLLKKIGSNIDILVLDIEGHEKTVLNSWKQIDRNVLPRIVVIECGYDWDERLQILKELGYNVDCYYFNNCYLNRESITINRSVAKQYNSEWKSFVWNGQTIYTNECNDSDI